MRTVYQAASVIEAHMLLDLLKQQGLSAEIHGEHLQGAIGELPAAGLVRLVVDEHDYAAARELIERWEVAQPAEVTKTAPPAGGSAGWWRFAIGLAIGIVATSVYYRLTSDGADRSGDGKADCVARVTPPRAA
jgi:hypothetical protein